MAIEQATEAAATRDNRPVDPAAEKSNVDFAVALDRVRSPVSTPQDFQDMHGEAYDSLRAWQALNRQTSPADLMQVADNSNRVYGPGAGARADAFIGAAPYTRSSALRALTHNGAWGCALLIGRVVGIDVTGVQSLSERLQSERGYTRLPISAALKPNDIVVLSNGSGRDGTNHVGMVTSTGAVLNNAYNKLKGRFEGVAESLEAMMGRHGSMRDRYILRPPRAR